MTSCGFARCRIVWVVIGLAVIMRAQPRPTPPPSFEVTSVKPHTGDFEFQSPQFLPGGRFTSDIPLGATIALAYGVPVGSDRLVGIPDWMRGLGGTFAIEAVAAPGAVPAGLSPQAREQIMRPMLQGLLADRFKLVVHRASKEGPVYALVVGKNGPKLRRAPIEDENCPDPSTNFAEACHEFFGDPRTGIQGRAVTLADLADELEYSTDRPVVDKTGIAGLFHIEMKGWQPLRLAGADAADNGDLPSLFTLLDQFGLKLESQKGPVAIYVIDHAERPEGN